MTPLPMVPTRPGLAMESPEAVGSVVAGPMDRLKVRRFIRTTVTLLDDVVGRVSSILVADLADAFVTFDDRASQSPPPLLAVILGHGISRLAHRRFPAQRAMDGGT